MLLLFCAGNANAQNAPAKDSTAPYWSDALAKIAYTPEGAGWYRFKPGAVKEGSLFFVHHKTAFGLGAADSMQLARTERDGAGRVHHRFQQYWNGIRIEGAEYLVHERNGFATSGNGKVVRGLKATTKPAINAHAALLKALQFVPAQGYKLHPSDKQTFAGGTYRPGAELVYQRPNADLPLLPQHLKLCYVYEIYKATGEGYHVYIDAQTGALINKLPLQSECAPTTVNTNFYGIKPLNTTASSNGYSLQDGCTRSQITVYNNNNSLGYSGTPYTSASNSDWNSTADLRSAATSLWACRRTIDFYNEVLGRNGYDGIGAKISVYQNAAFYGGAGISYNNASMTFSGGNMKIGNNSTNYNTDDWNSLDIIAHEFTHAVTGASSKLVYQGESGALNESYSDIMGVYAEYWDGTSPFDWLLGEDRGSAFRSLQNPGLYGHPNTYKSPVNWYVGTGDNGGVHLNSGVQNYWFYLLCNGGSGTNDNGKDYSVKGIGIATAGFIAYMTNAFYLTSESGYTDARNQSIQVAIDYYGSCSVAALETAKAWYAVGVGGMQTNANNLNVCGDYQASEGTLHFQSVDILPVGSDCSVTLYPAQNPYLFTASKSIVLYPGFKALEGTLVNMYIDSCDITLNTYAAKAAATVPQQSLVSIPLVETVPVVAPGNTNATITAFPNPASGWLQVTLQLPEKSATTIVELYDMQARLVRTQSLGPLAQGRHVVPLHITNLAAGTYTAVLRTPTITLRTRIVVIR